MFPTSIYAPGWQQDFLWCVVAAFIIAFLVAFAMGANDCANSYATVVGAGVLKLWQAYLMATVMETVGAMLLGYRVTETIRKSIVDASIYNVYTQATFNYKENKTLYYSINKERCAFINLNAGILNRTTCNTNTSVEFMIGEMATLGATALWVLLATVCRMPVSTTHSAVSATVGFSLVMRGRRGIHWMTIVKIVISWVVSPLLAGACAAVFYMVIKLKVLRKRDSFEAALTSLPFWYWFAIFVNLYAVFFNGSKYLGFDHIPWYGAVIISFGVGLIVAVCFRIFGVKYARWKVEKESNAVDNVKITEESAALSSEALSPSKVYTEGGPTKDDTKTVRVFYFLQVLSACFISFSHGSNDTANAIGPLVALWLAYRTGLVTAVDSEYDRSIQLLILFGAVSMIVGLWCLGHKVIKTMGTELTNINAPSGFCMELGTAFTVILGSRLNIPLSTTHCAVGAVVCVGLLKNGFGNDVVSWKLISGIFVTWIVTIPVTMAFSALFTYLLAHFYLETM